jgi:hypothetical protein
MSIVDLSGTRAVRYPDPPVPRVLPNGIQPYSAYTCLAVYYSSGSYTPEIGNIDQTGQSRFQMLLFGTDYPANVSATGFFLYDNLYAADGTQLPFLGLPIPAQAVATDNISAIIPAVAPAVPSITHYKQIVTGATLTNGVRISGFPMFAPVGGNQLYSTASGDEGDGASIAITVNALLNAAVIASASPYLALYDPAAIFLQIPILLWEGDFTQQIVDDGFVLTAVPFGGVTATLNVVGLWAIDGLTPFPPPPLDMGRRAGPPPSRIQQQIERLRELLPK